MIKGKEFSLFFSVCVDAHVFA